MSCVIESILKRHNRSCNEEVSEKDDEDHRPDNSEVEVIPHERHRVLLTHHRNDLLFQPSNQSCVLGQVWADKH